MGRTTAAIVSGAIVALLTGAVANSFLMAASWSSIHGGMSGWTLAVLSLIALAVPPGSAFLAGRAIYRSWGQWSLVPRRRTTRIADSIRMTCPHCGCAMKRSAEYAATSAFTVVQCPIHGPFHFGPNTPLTLGVPSQV